MVHACLHACSYQALAARLHEAAEIFNYEFGFQLSGCDAICEALRCISKVYRVRYASRSYMHYPSHVAEMLGQLDDGRFFYYEDMHANKDACIRMSCSLVPEAGTDDSEDNENEAAVDYNEYMRALSVDLNDERLVLATGPDLHSVLQQLDRRCLLGLVQERKVGHSTDRCGCVLCAEDALICRYGVLRHVQVHGELDYICDELFDPWMAAENDENESSYGSTYSEVSVESHSASSWLPNACKRSIEWVLELLEDSNLVYDICIGDFEEIQSSLNCILSAVECGDDVELCRGTCLFEAVKDLARLKYGRCPDTYQLPVENLAFTQSTCSDVFISGPRAGQPLWSLVDALKAGDASALDFCFDAVKVSGKLRVLGDQGELWCLKQYAWWLSGESLQAESVEVDVTIWPLARSMQYKDGFVLQHFLDVSSTTCDGEEIELLHVSEIEAMALRDSVLAAEAGEDGICDELAHDIDSAQQLWPILCKLEKEMLTAQGKSLVTAIRKELSDLQNQQVCVSNCSNVCVQDDIGANTTSVEANDVDKFPPQSSDVVEYIEPDEAQAIVETCWVTSIEARIAAAKLGEHTNPANARPSHSKGRLVRLRFDRHPGVFDHALKTMPLARELAKRGIDTHPPWANGAKILDEGAQFLVDETRMELAPCDVIVREDDQDAVFTALRDIRWEKRPKLKRGKERRFVPEDGLSSLFHGSSSASGGSSGSDLTEGTHSVHSDEEPLGTLGHAPFVVKKTFIHFEACHDSHAMRRVRSCTW